MTTPEISPRQHAAKVVLEAECEGLTKLQEAFNAFDTRLSEIAEALDLPENYPSNARRVVNETKSNFAYRRTTELPALLRQMGVEIEQSMAPPPPPMPAP